MIEERLPTVSGAVIEAGGGLLTTVERRYVVAIATDLAITEEMHYEISAPLVDRHVEVEKRVPWDLAEMIDLGDAARRDGKTRRRRVRASGDPREADQE
jgi:hypothetical protein